MCRSLCKRAVPRGLREHSVSHIRRAHQPTRCARRVSVCCCAALEFPTGVAYSAHTDTLFVATIRINMHIVCTVRSFARTNAEWHECHRLDPYYPIVGNVNSYYRDSLRVLSDGSIVFRFEGLLSVELQMLAADDSRAMQTRASIRLPSEHCGFDTQLAAGETRLAFALRTPERVVALFRVAGERAEELARCPLSCLIRPLFCRDSLLALVSTGDDYVVLEFGTGGGRLEPRRVHLSGLNNFICWYVVNDSLLTARGLEDETTSLTLYNIR